MPGTATTSSPRTTSGHDSRSERGIFASTNRSWIFFFLPASRSPGLQPRTLSPASSERILHAPHRHLAGEIDRAVLEPEPVVLAHRLKAAAEIERFEPAGDASNSASAGVSVARMSSARRTFSSAAGCRRRSSGRISSRIRPRFVSALLASDPELESLGCCSTPPSPHARHRAAGGRPRPPAAARSRRRCRGRRAGRGSSRPGRRRCGQSRASRSRATE